MNETVDSSPNHPSDSGWMVDRLKQSWKTIAIAGILGGIAACFYTYSRPAVYAGHVTIFFPSKPSVLGSNALVDSALGGAAAALTGSAPTPLRVYEAFLSSETAVQSISKANGLKREEFMGRRSIESDARASILNITFVDFDKERDLKVLQSHVKELAAINRKVAFDTSTDDLAVLKQRLKDSENAMKRSEDELIEYQRTLISAPNVNAQMGGTISATPSGWAAELVRLRLDEVRIDNLLATSKERVRMLAVLPRDVPTELPPVRRLTPALQDAEYQLALKRLTLGPESPEITRLEKTISVLRSQMEREIRTYLQGVNTGIIDPSVTEGSLPQLLMQKVGVAAQIAVIGKLANVAPDESVKLNRRYRQLALQATVVQQLTSQVFQVSIQAQRDPNRWVVLDDPWIETKPTNKSFVRMGLAGILAGAIVGGFFALLRREARR